MHELGKLRAVPMRPEARPGLTARALSSIRSTIMRPIAADVPDLQALDQTARSENAGLPRRPGRLMARAFSAPIESERGSSSLSGRIFATQTGVQFAGKCSKLAPASRPALRQQPGMCCPYARKAIATAARRRVPPAPR